MNRAALGAVLLGLIVTGGCGTLRPQGTSPTAAGLNSNNLIDPVAQAEGDRLGDVGEFHRIAQRFRKMAYPEGSETGPRRTALALSGGGAYGAYSAGVLYGWTKSGTRPNFDVVTGISTGSLIAPLAFLGPKYDEQLKRFYTQLGKDDIFRILGLRGLFSEAFASNAPLARQLDIMVTPEMITDLAIEHRKGRRLYVGTTVRDARRFVVWDIGAIACRGQADDSDLIKSVLIGSAAIPGFFPSSAINVTVDGQPYQEHHVDGGTSVSVFFRPPYAAPNSGRRTDDFADTDLYVIVAGKLYADPDVVETNAIKIALDSVSTVAYAQTRGDLQRIYFIAMLTGMSYNLASIPEAYPAPKSNTDFDPVIMTGMFNEGMRQVCQGTVWRKSPPGVEPGESPLERAGTTLITSPRSQPSTRSDCWTPAPPK